MKNMINKLLAFMIALVAFCAVLAFSAYVETHYTRECTVIDVSNEVITLKDECGYLWEYEGTGCETGDKVIAKMYNNHTDSNVFDDVIIDVKDAI